nr:tyrosine--tRNA ligase 1, cytoplasmic [Tanacetum cinerariifolium]
MKTIKVNKLTSAGCEVKILVADYFAKLNNKMDGDMKKIRVVGEYMIEIWKAVGMNLENVELLWSSDEINKSAQEYWDMVINIATKNSLARIMRVFSGYEELVADYAKGDLHPADLKPALSKALNEILQPVRDHFENDKKALLEKVKGVTKLQNDASAFE